jgi:hypothetical protein
MVESAFKQSLLGSEVENTISDHSLKQECPDIYLDDHLMDLKFSPS